MKGQASLEYLVLCVIALTMLALSFSALIGMREAALRGALAIESGKSASMLATAAREVCALGSGNGREMRIGGPMAVESEKADAGWIVRFSPQNGQNGSIARHCPCEVENLEGISGLVYVKNENGKIRIRGR